MVVAAFRGIEGRDPLEACFLRVQTDGTSLGYRTYFYGYYQYCNSICMSPEDGFLLCGSKKEQTYQTNDLFLVKRVPGSGWVWEQTIGGPASDWGSSIVPAGTGYYIISGHTASFGAGGFDAWLLLLKEPAAGTPAANGRPEGPRLDVPGPNPVAAVTTIRFSIPEAMRMHLAVYDVTGRRIALLTDGLIEAGEHTCVWNGKNRDGVRVSPGVYLVQMSAGDFSATRKAVVLK